MRGKCCVFCPGCARERLRLEISNVLFAGRPAAFGYASICFPSDYDYIFTLWAKRPQT